MAISYNIYANDGQGGDIDYSMVMATTPSLSYLTSPLAAPGDYKFAVRAIDTVSGIEEANTDARVRIVLDPAGNDVTASPNGVVGLSVWPTAGGTCRVSWGYDATGQGGPPSQFNVSLTPGPTASLTNLAASVAYFPGVAGYGCTLSGLPADVLCTIAVQPVGSTSLLLGPVATVPITYFSISLRNVDSLIATAMP